MANFRGDCDLRKSMLVYELADRRNFLKREYAEGCSARPSASFAVLRGYGSASELQYLFCDLGLLLRC